MMLALVIMPTLVLTTGTGDGFGAATDRLDAVDPSFMSWTSGLTVIGFFSAIAWGLGYFGQPHIIVRFMAVRTVNEVAAARNIGMTWMGISLTGAIGLGIFGRAYAERNNLNVADPETIFIVLAELLFHPLVTGFLYAALLAAIMSTISSQLLVASSSLTEDFYRLFLRRNAGESEAVLVGRGAVLLVGLIAIVLAADPDSQVLGLVANAWAGFGSAFGPLILLALTWPRMTGAGALAGMVTGAVVVIGWIAAGWSDSFLGGPGVYEMIPGFISSGLMIIVVSLLTKSRGEFRELTPEDREPELV
jgi:SSS family solute:Na+ symporter